MSEPSERMRGLMAALEASTIAGHDMHVNALLTAITELEQRVEKAEAEVKDMSRFLSTAKLEALCTKLFGCDKAAWWLGGENAPFITEALKRIESLEVSNNKWKRVAVAREMRDRTQAAYNRVQIRDELLGAREDAWTKADLEFAEAIAALGEEWTEAVK